MITTFYFDEEMFQDNIFLEHPTTTDHILKTWSKYGCLAYCEKDKGYILKSLQNVPPKFSQKWSAAIQHLKKTPITLENSKLSDFESYNLVDKALTQQGVMIGILPNDFLELFQVDNTGKLEIISPLGIHDSKHFANSEKYSSLDIGVGDNIDDIWNRSLKNLSLYSKSIIIIDRYLIQNIMDDYEQGKETSIEKFSKYLSTNNKPYNINILSACDINGQITNSGKIKAYLNDILRGKNYIVASNITFTVGLCKNKFFSQHAHDRMIVMDKHVIQTGNGLDIFRNQPLGFCQFNIKNKELTKFDEINSRLQKNREPGLSSL
ncbi:hypothetical protein [Photobacterium phosphoreum]|uniref:hypothetical protein n=1 Tax=Photobacterium phosphoreum TaxID=659 RepID=UPI000D1790EB|nr:hypothetical protein [Photobacterium phosphoreum]PTB31289.1 hypothetical protein DAT36_17560 [Photobacterium phosphoreum]